MRLLISEMKIRVLNIDVLLIKVSITDDRRHRHFVFFHGGHLETHPKIRPKILGVSNE